MKTKNTPPTPGTLKYKKMKDWLANMWSLIKSQTFKYLQGNIANSWQGFTFSKLAGVSVHLFSLPIVIKSNFLLILSNMWIRFRVVNNTAS